MGPERRGRVVRAWYVLVNRMCSGRGLMDEVKAQGKPFGISRAEVWEAWVKVRGNQGAAGVDGVSVEAFEKDLENNLYRVWNRMASGTYFPPEVRAVAIPKAGGGARILGVPTVGDRVAQTVVAGHLSARVERVFHPDSYGYRPGRSALDAVAACRARCFRFDWVVEFDIRKFFDTVPHEKIVACVRAHTDARWVVLYVRRWLAAGLRMPDGSTAERSQGTPQGSAVSPVLANLLLHYVFDVWMDRQFPDCPFERYADDAVVHCRTLARAQQVLAALRSRMAEAGLELHPDKTRIVYCQQRGRSGGGPGPGYPHTQFTFLGYTFRPRKAVDGNGVYFTGFLPAISRQALKRLSGTVRSWDLHRRVGESESALARMINPVIRGWMGYYGRFYRSALDPLFHRVNTYLLRWIRRKYRLGWRKAVARLAGGYRLRPGYFAHWAWTPPAGTATRTTRAE
jgi:RNA-directed DNA polymerase